MILNKGKILGFLKPWHKTFVVMTYDAVIIVLSFLLSFSLRYGEAFPQPFSHWYFWKALLISSVIQFSCFYYSGIYKAIWRFSSLPDLIRILKGVSAAIPINILILFLFTRLEDLPRSTFLIDWGLLVMGLGGGRFAYRILSDKQRMRQYDSKGFEKVILIGAGRGGEKILRDISSDPSLNMKVVAIIDEDEGKRGRILHGVKVMGSIKDLAIIARESEATKAFIAIPSATSREVKNIAEACTKVKLDIKILPKVSDIFHGRIELSQLRSLEPDDFLGRDAVKLDINSMRDMINEKTIMITGAGGSIGSELSVQIAHLQPKKIILFEMTELFLYNLEKNLIQKFGNDIELVPVIGDVRDLIGLEKVFRRHRPEIVFHAAAYKHVPMMEINPTEAIKTNIIGSKNVAEMALEYQAEKFVLISTDKAVNPTNVMGATKRVAEIVCQTLNQEKQTKFITLRFGNVLGSSGSVIPLFKKQIQEGGPITVTHPEIKRYFMSIPEASQLVIQAGSFGNGGEIFILDMGEPILITDLAKEMIRMAGLKLGEDIEIEYTGLRPGEKLYEELFMSSEKLIPTNHPKVRVAKVRNLPESFQAALNSLIETFTNLSDIEVKTKLKQLVPEYIIKEEDLTSKLDSVH